MALNYHGISQNPGSLNSWLKSQPDGYLRNGWLNWLALTRFSRLFGPTILEYRRGGSDTGAVDADLNDQIPVILEDVQGEGSHFVVANGKLTDGYAILDPESEANTSWSGFRSMRRLLLTHTNLSALLLTFDNNLSLSGLTGGELNQEMPMDEDGGDAVSGPAFQTYLINQPDDGSYQLTLTASTSGWFKWELYAYDQQASVGVRQESVYLATGEAADYQFGYNQNTGEISQWHRQMDFNQILEDIDLAYNQGWIKKKSAWKDLRKQMQKAAQQYDKRKLKTMRQSLRTWQKKLNSYNRENRVTDEGATYLLKELEYLKASL